MDNWEEKLKRTKIIPISCGICKMDCANCVIERLIREHNENVDKLLNRERPT